MKDFTTLKRVTIGVYFQWFLRSFMLYMVVIFKSSSFFLDFFALMLFLANIGFSRVTKDLH